MKDPCDLKDKFHTAIEGTRVKFKRNAELGDFASLAMALTRSEMVCLNYHTDSVTGEAVNREVIDLVTLQADKYFFHLVFPGKSDLTSKRFFEVLQRYAR